MTTQEQQAPSAQAREDTSAANRRQLKNYFKKPVHQLKFAYYQIGVGFIIFSTTMWLVRMKLAEVDMLLRDTHVAEAFVPGQIQEAYSQIVEYTLVGFAGYVAFTFVYSIVMSHRISGPIVAIVAFVDELIKGNYADQRNLRPHDQLSLIMTRLQKLRDVLRTGE